jgi:hypothetical protein
MAGGMLRKNYEGIINNDLISAIATEMIRARVKRKTRDQLFKRLLKKGGVLNEAKKENKERIVSGFFDINRGAYRFTQEEAFAYGACALVTLKARSAGYEVLVPPAKDAHKLSKEELRELFAPLGLPTV